MGLYLWSRCNAFADYSDLMLLFNEITKFNTMVEFLLFINIKYLLSFGNVTRLSSVGYKYITVLVCWTAIMQLRLCWKYVGGLVIILDQKKCVVPSELLILSTNIRIIVNTSVLNTYKSVQNKIANGVVDDT